MIQQRLRTRGSDWPTCQRSTIMGDRPDAGDSRIEGSISKRGSGRVRWLLVQAANTAVHTCNDEYLSRFHDRLASRKNSQKAIVATARKMLVSIYHMLDRGEVYDPPGVSA
jgi:transposase